MRDDLLDVAAVDRGKLGGLHVAQQVASPAVDHLRRSPGGAGTEVVLLDQRGLEAAHRRVPRNAAAVDAATDNNQVEGFHPLFITD